MREMLNKIAVQGNEERYRAICDILDELNVEYRIQEKSHSYSVPIYEKTKEENLGIGFHQMSLFEAMGYNLDDDSLLESEDFEEEDCEEEDNLAYYEGLDIFDEEVETKICIQELAEEFDVDLVPEINEIDYEVIAEAAEGWGFNLPDFEEFKKQYCSESNKKKRKRAFSSYGSWRPPKIIGYEEHTNSTKNIIVSLKNLCKNPNAEKIVLLAHYDAVNNSTGANDNGSGIVILLSFIKNVVDKGITDKWFEVVFEDKEETGGIGAKNYIEEFGKDIGEVINLDTCGVGDNIIIANESEHPVEGTNILVDENIIEKYDVLVYPYLPYCDSNVFKNAKYDVMTICTLPTNEEKDEKEKYPWSKYLDEKNENLIMKKMSLKGISEVYKYMHNGARDSIDWIRYDTMQKILDYISLLI